MIVFVLIALAVCVAFCPAAVFGTRRQRKPPEIRGDWWTKFEADFRAYAASVAAAERSERRRGARRPPT